MIQVVKSSGVSQQFIPEKLLKVLTWASEGTSIDPYSIYEKVKPYIRDGISSKELQQNVIKVAASSISIEEPDYQFVASNLAMFALRKEVYGQFDAPSLLEQISVNVGRGVYDKEILQKYSIDEIDELDNYIDHSKDFTFSYAGTMQLKEKYLVKDRSSNKIFETPQFSYILIAMCLHQEEKENRLDKVKAMYDALANKQISLPTPIMAGVRTPTRQFSSCVVIEGGDSLNGINKAANSIIKYISKRAGIGVNAGMIRAEGSKIGAGEVRHTGVIPFWKHLQTAVKSCLTPNTLVWALVDGKEKETQIQYIKVGDKIKSFENRKVTFKEVTDVWETVVEHDRQVDLYFSNGSIINCSTNHPIMVYSGDEVIQKYPLDLTDNDMIVGENGFITYLSKVEKGNHSTRYIDITVADTNVFFASSNGLSSVLTHNCSQGGIRGGAATLFYPMWHLEVENLLVLKNNRGVEENRIRHLDYGVQINDLMINRLLNDSYITLFSPDVENGQLYDLYFRDKQAFTEMYERLEKSDVRKKRIKASDLFELFMTERANTARIYPYFVDNVGDHGTFDRFTSPVKQSNLCLEIAIPTEPLDSEDGGEIGLCTLSAFVLSSFDWHDQNKINELAEIQVRALDNLLDYQDYPVEAALKALDRRSLGVGVTNYATWLADNFLDYSTGKEETHELFERLQYGLLLASVKLAKEKGHCEYYHKTNFSKGILPIDNYKKTVDELVAPNYVCDWEYLRAEMLKYGIRNSTVSALMPCESSSQVSNSTNGIEPPRGPVSIKESKEGAFAQVVPNVDLNLDLYDYSWKMAKRTNIGYIEKVVIMQKFVCQSISSNLYYDPANYPTGKVPMSTMLAELLHLWYYGGKTAYYHNTRDGSGTDDYESVAKPADCEGCSV